jgi:hypothetical protein
LDTNPISGSWNQSKVGIGQLSKGTFDPAIRVLTIHYYQPWNKREGWQKFTLSADGKKLEGHPANGQGWDWACTRNGGNPERDEQPRPQPGVSAYVGEHPVTLTFSKATPSGMTSQTCILEIKPNGDLRITNKNASSLMDDMFGKVDAGGNIKIQATSGSNSKSFEGRFSGPRSASGQWSWKLGYGDIDSDGTWSTGHTPSTPPVAKTSTAQTVQPTISLQTCDPNNVTFTVPGGKTAIDFSFEGLTAGVTCTTRIHITDKAWGISSGPSKRTGDVYYYNENGLGTKYETPVPLKNLTLAQGTYTFHVDGGRGASVIIKFILF